MTPTPDSPEGLTVEELAQLKALFAIVVAEPGVSRVLWPSVAEEALALITQVERLTAEQDAALDMLLGRDAVIELAGREVNRLEGRIARLKEAGAIQCPMGGDDDPDPCRVCGATVSGNDPVHGVCQAGNAFGVEQKARADTLAAENERMQRIVTGLSEQVDAMAAGPLPRRKKRALAAGEPAR